MLVLMRPTFQGGMCASVEYRRGDHLASSSKEMETGGVVPCRVLPCLARRAKEQTLSPILKKLFLSFLCSWLVLTSRTLSTNSDNTRREHNEQAQEENSD